MYWIKQNNDLLTEGALMSGSSVKDVINNYLKEFKPSKCTLIVWYIAEVEKNLFERIFIGNFEIEGVYTIREIINKNL